VSPVTDCARALEMIQDWLRREVTPAHATELEAHLNACAACRGHAEFESRFRDAIERATAQERCPAETRARLLAALDREREG
jgi:anti-sigma factor (TIGR02949 family)